MKRLKITKNSSTLRSVLGRISVVVLLPMLQLLLWLPVRTLFSLDWWLIVVNGVLLLVLTPVEVVQRRQRKKRKKA